MSPRRPKRPRLRPGALFYSHARRVGLVVALACALAPGRARAQETDTVRLGAPDTLTPPPADSFVVVDSILEPDDTVTQEREIGDTLAADSVPPGPPRIVTPLHLPRPLGQGFAEGVWVWQREDLLRSTALTVGDLLERVPSLTRVRSGYYAESELTVSAAALPGDVEVLLDGYPMDPLTSTTLDLASLSLVDVGSIRVERRSGRLRIELFSLEQPDPRGGFETSPDSGANTYTRVEIATGDLDTDALAGSFMAPRFLFGPFALAISRLDSDGAARAAAGRTSGAWLRWGLLRSWGGVHAEYRRGSVEREPGTSFPGEMTRQDVVLRARVRPFDFLSAELYGGHSAVDDRFIDDSVATELSTTHFGSRASYDRGPLSTQASLRFRNGDGGPGLEGELVGDLRPLSWIGIAGEIRHEDWDDATFDRYGASARVGPFLGARLFAEWSDGSHGIHWLTRAGGTPGVERSLERAGVDWQLGGWRAGVAAFHSVGDSVAPPAIPGIGASGSRALALLPGFDVEGIEASFRIPLVWDPLGLEGSYTRMSAGSDGIFGLFQPAEQGRAALVYHGLPLDGDQLEVVLRFEGEYRGSMQSPDAEGVVVVVDPARRLNLELNIRVLDIHAYVSWQNILNAQQLNDLPALNLPGQTAYFGVKWELWN